MSIILDHLGEGPRFKKKTEVTVIDSKLSGQVKKIDNILKVLIRRLL